MRITLIVPHLQHHCSVAPGLHTGVAVRLEMIAKKYSSIGIETPRFESPYQLLVGVVVTKWSTSHYLSLINAAIPINQAFSGFALFLFSTMKAKSGQVKDMFNKKRPSREKLAEIDERILVL